MSEHNSKTSFYPEDFNRLKEQIKKAHTEAKAEYEEKKLEVKNHQNNL